ncbi:IclR family transcriptional regulator [Malonomonas rubra]|uniref:IclR family transcriptional regulator n=1 Tax=Malonomonas rubra TaxID=57040 RepID=UPI0026EAF4ED|nr:IclR family transcriptional regulator [Malonomonas rubra]
MQKNNKDSYTIRTVEKALSILEAISEVSGNFRVSQLSDKLGMDKSYVYRVLATFEKHGYVQHVTDSNKYCTGPMAYETGSKFLHQMQLLQKAKPIMESVAQETAEAVYLVIPISNDVLFLEFVDSPQQVRVMPLVGKRFPLQQVSAGKVIQAHNKPQSQMLSRDQGISRQEDFVDHGLVGAGIGSLSVPILDVQQFAVASFSLIAPDFRLSHERIEQSLMETLLDAGRQLSEKLGYFNAKLFQKCF